MMNPTVEYITDFIQSLIDDRTFKSDNFMGEGSSREVYKLTDDLVIKLPKYFSREKENRPISFWHGMCQSNIEIDVWENASDLARTVLNPIVIYGKYEDLVWEVQPIVDICDDICCAYTVMEFAEEQKVDFMSEEEYNDIVCELVLEFGLQDGDLYDNSGNFGINSDGKIVVIDYGFLGWESIDDYLEENYGQEANYKRSRSCSACSNSYCSDSWDCSDYSSY